MTPHTTCNQRDHDIFLPRVIPLACAVCVVLLIPMRTVQAASVSDIPNRTTLRSNDTDIMISLINESGANGEIGFYIHPIAPHSVRNDDQLDVQNFGIQSMSRPLTPKYYNKNRNGIDKNGDTNRHEPRYHEDDGPFFFGRAGEFSFHENKWDCRLWGKGIYPSGIKCDVAPVPAPGAAWLFGSGLLCLFVVTRLKKEALRARSLR